MLAYLDQLAVSQRPATIQSTDTALRLFASFVLDHDPKLRSVRQLQRRHIEAYKTDAHDTPRARRPVVEEQHDADAARDAAGVLRTDHRVGLG